MSGEKGKREKNAGGVEHCPFFFSVNKVITGGLIGEKELRARALICPLGNNCYR